MICSWFTLSLSKNEQLAWKNSMQEQSWAISSRCSLKRTILSKRAKSNRAKEQIPNPASNTFLHLLVVLHFTYYPCYWKKYLSFKTNVQLFKNTIAPNWKSLCCILKGQFSEIFVLPVDCPFNIKYDLGMCCLCSGTQRWYHMWGRKRAGHRISCLQCQRWEKNRLWKTTEEINK